jgi:hypothetical protein
MAQCLSPYTKKDQEHGMLTFPCGKCPCCLTRRVSQWSFRLQYHERAQESAHFITFTYDNDHVQLTKNGFLTLDKRDCQKFFKRLRKRHSKNPDYKHLKISYYICGEYGGTTDRPHYHAIIFNADIWDIYYAWDLGEIHAGDVTGSSVGYTLKYMSKPPSVPKHQNDDRQKEFALMSKGIGKNYITPEMKRWHKANLLERSYVPLPGGSKASMPRYYKDKIYTDIEKKKISIHLEQIFLEEERLKSDENIAFEHAVKVEKIRKFARDQRNTTL